MNTQQLQNIFISNIPSLVDKAHKENWCVKHNHCLLRLIYDYIFLDDYRKHVQGSPVFKSLSKDQLERGITLIRQMHTCNKEFVNLLQIASLKYRNKLNDR